jgi:hypothetical protein
MLFFLAMLHPKQENNKILQKNENLKGANCNPNVSKKGQVQVAA